MINNHPTHAQLLAFAEGSLVGAEALVISAHCDMCSCCAEKVKLLTEKVAKDQLQNISEKPQNDSFSSMLDMITRLPASTQISAVRESTYIELDGKQFRLPRSLRRYAESTGNWSKLVGKLWQAPVDIGGDSKATFIYMEKGGSVPEHTHKGNEMTLVINGRFSDGISEYRNGDFIEMNGNHTHAPFSDDEEGCLVFSIVNQPLHFTSGVARLLNPFSQLFF
jgi:putative transcriptional regulator